MGLSILCLDEVEVIGVPPLADEYPIRETVLDSMREICSMLDLDPQLPERVPIRLDYSQVGSGYAKPTGDSLATLIDFARTEGVFLDPVYTSKAAASLRSLPQDGKRTLFWHTGGTTAIFAYADQLLNSVVQR